MTAATSVPVRALVTALVAALGVVALARTGSAQTADELFDASRLQEVRLWINTRDLAQLHAQYDQNTHYPADLEWRGIRVRNVAVRSRGFGSRNPLKIGLAVDMDHYTEHQQYLGLSSLVLDNLWQDPSMVREFLAMGFLQRLGQPAPREAFARLYINNDFQGLYAVVEDIDAAFVARATGDASGALFEHHWTFPFYGEDLGHLDAYKPMFEPRTREQDADPVIWGPIQDLWQAVNDPDDAVWRSRVDRLLDLEQFVTQAAIENYLAENDGLAGYAGLDNFYLYREPGGPRHRVFAWDKDSTFLQHDFALLQGVEANHLMRRALGDPQLFSLYRDVLATCAIVDRDETWLAARLEAAVAVIASAAYEDPRKPVANATFDEAIVHLRRFAEARSRFVLERIALLSPPAAGPDEHQRR